ncbi:hypothetical protein NDU88_003921 [Pleurodeles waltl]|uniref:Uncharacterized protein n=1 Tax=Pleurodeles waltl TaxID=8319 RepID=A0AAV7M6R0_PLEWA|nr:hypothetical protein NDU88_003921 [Pleurodeles waltl]
MCDPPLKAVAAAHSIGPTAERSTNVALPPQASSTSRCHTRWACGPKYLPIGPPGVASNSLRSAAKKPQGHNQAEKAEERAPNHIPNRGSSSVLDCSQCSS